MKKNLTIFKMRFWEKFKRKSKPVRIVISPTNRVSQSPGRPENVVGKPPVNTDFELAFEEPNEKKDKNDIYQGFRKKSKTEPALVLSEYRKKQREKPQNLNIRHGKFSGPRSPKSPRTPTDFSASLVNKCNAFPGEVESVMLAGTIGSIASFSGSQLFSTVVDDADKVDVDIFNNFEFPLRNLVFEGGGNKGMAYVGALQVIVISWKVAPNSSIFQI